MFKIEGKTATMVKTKNGKVVANGETGTVICVVERGNELFMQVKWNNGKETVWRHDRHKIQDA